MLHRLVIKPEACSKKERKSLVANQRIWLETRMGRNTLVVVTDGSLTNKAAGWAITGIHAGQTLFEYKVPLAKRASNYDTEMMALTHASRLIYEIMLGELDIRRFRIFSDSTAALTSIFDPGLHAAQHASHIFPLGTRAQIPTGYMVKTLRSQSTCDSNMPSDQMLSTF